MRPGRLPLRTGDSERGPEDGPGPGTGFRDAGEGERGDDGGADGFAGHRGDCGRERDGILQLSGKPGDDRRHAGGGSDAPGDGTRGRRRFQRDEHRGDRDAADAEPESGGRPDPQPRRERKQFREQKDGLRGGRRRRGKQADKSAEPRD